MKTFRFIAACVMAVVSVLALLPAVFAAEYYVATSGNDANPGTLAAPFRTVLKGLQTVQNGDTLYIREGTYRLMDESASGYTFNKAGASASNFVTIQAYPGETPILLGSLASQPSVWEQHNETVWRTNTSFLVHGPTGMFDGARRVPHKMMWDGGNRMHANVSLITPNTWTIARDDGYRCTQGNVTNCYVYYWPLVGEDPNTKSYEFSQRHMGRIVTDYLTIRGITFRYTQNAGVYFEGADFVVLEDNVFEHNSNGNDNAYGTGVWYGQGSRITGNRLFDSCYWDPYYGNSHGFAFMNSIPGGFPHIVENNTITNPCGTGISVKNGVSNLIARNNHITAVVVAIVTSGGRCEWTKPSCVPGDPEYFPGGNWSIYGNLIENSNKGVELMIYSEAGTTSNRNKVYNNVFRNVTYGVDVKYSSQQSYFNSIANNIFIQSPNAIFLNNGGTGTQRFFPDFIPLFDSTNNLFFGNTNTYALQRDWGGGGSSRIAYTLAQAQSYGKENGSFILDPLFAETTEYTLAATSPAVGAANASWWSSDLADIGRWPNARNISIEPPATGICEATGTGRCFYIDPVNGDDDWVYTDECSLLGSTWGTRETNGYYQPAVDCSGGTFAQPWKTPQLAAICSGPGDVVYFMSGEYGTTCQLNPANSNFSYQGVRSGTQEHPIVLKPYPGENPVFKSRFTLSNLGSQWHILDGLTFDGFGVSMGSANNVIQNSRAFNVDSDCGNNPSGIGIPNGAENITVLNNTIHDNYHRASGPFISGHFNCAGIKVMHNPKNVAIINNTIYNEPAGIHLKYSEGVNITVRGNRFFNTKWGVFANNNNVLFEENIFSNNVQAIKTGGSDGVSLGGHNVTMRLNTFHNNSVDVGVSSGNALQIERNIFSNPLSACSGNPTGLNSATSCPVFISNGYYGIGGFPNADFTNFTFQDNCFIANANRLVWRYGMDGIYNTYHNLSDVQTRFAEEQGSIYVDPQFVSAAAGDFRLQEGSPCSAMGAYASRSPVVRKVGDLNGDGIVDIQDVIMIIQNFKRRQSYDAGADINQDGVVNIFDMVLLGRQWG